MQPYFFPYIGYYQMIRSVDTFVIYDDVNYIKQGWINRNRILLNGKELMITVRLKGASSFRKINEIEISGEYNFKIIRTIEQAYKKAPHFNDVFPLVSGIILHKENNLARYLINSIETVITYLGINTSILISSEIEKDNKLSGENKIIEICKRLNATHYINAIGGEKLYSKENFARNDIKLNFIQTKNIQYRQFKNEFIPWLSVIDILMFNSPAEIHNLLDQIELI